MQSRQRHLTNSAARRSRRPCHGLSRGEVLLTIAFIILLAALILPQMQIGRNHRRRSVCIEHQHNLMVALMNYVGMHRELLPPLRGQASIEDDADPATPPRRRTWVIDILPQLDQRALYDRLTALTVQKNRLDSSDDDFKHLSQLQVPEFTCPDGPRHEQPGAISYVANAGYMPADDWLVASANTTGPNIGRVLWRVPGDSNDAPSHRAATEQQLDIAQAAAVFIDPLITDGSPRFSDRRNGYEEYNGLSPFDDGVSSTILFAENDDAGRWADNDLLSIGFGLPLETPDRVPQFVGDGTSEQALALQPGFSIGMAGINAYREERRLARPSSSHPGGAIVTFGDGHYWFLSEQIDRRVYASILTPSGSRYGQEIVTSGQLSE